MSQLIKQYEALEEYFLKFMPKKYPSVCKENERYKRICRHLQDKKTLMYLSFLVIVAIDFQEFLTLCQTEGLLVHILYDGLKEIIRNL